ncbi:MAG: FAD-dependent oxidoreductase [Flavobacterium sp.]
MESATTSYTACTKCRGRGKISRGIAKKLQLQYKTALAQFEQTKTGTPPPPPKAHIVNCPVCGGSGLVAAAAPPSPNPDYPHIAIIGAGIGGTALAVACLHRGIPFTLYERDANFEARSQGYGLTMQQANKALKGFGVTALADGVVSTKHVVHTTDGAVMGEWGFRKWVNPDAKAPSRQSNTHIARQSLRMELLTQLGGSGMVQWGHTLADLTATDDGKVTLTFEADAATKTTTADLVVGADGIRSQVRNLTIADAVTPLRYLNCIVMLGICPLNLLDGVASPLLDSATVFQTANGNERIYMMPFTHDSVMWQLSFPMAEDDAKALSFSGPEALKAEAQRRTQWHSPIPEILAATPVEKISGYPVYDRELLSKDALSNIGAVTLIGDAAHPMSPFKGQGANQALLDALSLARSITTSCRPGTDWREIGVRESLLNTFEQEMLERSAVKVNDSAKAAQFLHSDVVLKEKDGPRGNC